MKKAWWNSVRHWISWADDSISVYSLPVVSVQKAQAFLKSGTTDVMLSRDIEQWLMLSTMSNIYLHGPNHISMVVLSCNLYSQNMVWGPTKLASPGSLLDMQILRPHLRPNQTQICMLTRSPGDSCVL